MIHRSGTHRMICDGKTLQDMKEMTLQECIFDYYLVFFRLHKMIKREDTDKKTSITELTFPEEEGMLIAG